MRVDFAPSEQSSVGIEWELALVDLESGELTPSAEAVLEACGGGETEQTFTATRVIAFGDETSVINADGSKYTVNALVSGSTATLPIESPSNHDSHTRSKGPSW